MSYLFFAFVDKGTQLFPRGKYTEPRDFKIDGSEISATDLYYFAQRGVPDKVKVLRYFEDIDQINAKTVSLQRSLYKIGLLIQR